jgi:sterol 3beta-glucosyltransferase
MKVFIITYGTRGDVQPCLALAEALMRAGHEAVVAGPASSDALATGHGIDFAALDDGLTRLWENPHMRRERNRRRGLPGVRALREAVRPAAIPSVRPILEQAWKAARGADVVLHNGALLASASRYIADGLAVPFVLSQMYPLFTPTRAFPTALYRFPGSDRYPGALNRATYRAMLFMLDGLVRSEVEKWREETFGARGGISRTGLLRRGDGTAVPVLNAVSPHVLPPPPDWPDTVHTTGYWLLPTARDWTPPRDLSDFLAAGEPPVYVGFGSMISADPGSTGDLVMAAVRRCGVRAVLATGRGGLEASDVPPEIFLLDHAPHDWLFPRMRAVVHHGGPGTAATAIAAGRPQVLCPFMADQPFWADRFNRLGLAAAPQPHATLSVEGLADAVRSAIEDEGMAQRAELMGRMIRAEDGAAEAVRVLEKIHEKTTPEDYVYASH